MSRIEQPIDIGNGTHVRVTASLGIAIYPEDGHEVVDLIKKADEAMYRAKREERSYCFFDMNSVCK
ncbi:MAG: diguanylate cyclase [Desulfovibrionales bacterium]